jgi:carbon dioxide concentrating mechanism protein CcmL
MRRRRESPYDNIKLQDPSSREDPSTNLQYECPAIAHFGFWSLVFLWCLELGGWIFLMRLGTVIGRVTVSQTVPALKGARWLIVSPFTREHFQQGTDTPPGMSKDPSLVVYDDLGGGVGQTIGFVEGREAASPFDQPTPVDAINAALVDEIFYNPFTK